MARTATKSVALTVAAGVLTFGVQQLTAGNTTTGAVALVIGAVVFTGYQLAEEKGHGKAANDLAERIGADNLERLSEVTADEIDELIANRKWELTDKADSDSPRRN